MSHRWRITRAGALVLILMVAVFVAASILGSAVLLGTGAVLLLILGLAASGTGSMGGREMGGTGFGPGYDPKGRHNPDGYDGD